MSEQMPRTDEESYVQDKNLAHDMAIAEDPGRTEAQRVRDTAKDLIDTAVEKDLDEMQLTEQEMKANNELSFTDGSPNHLDIIPQDDSQVDLKNAKLKMAYNQAATVNSHRRTFESVAHEANKQIESSLSIAKTASGEIERRQESGQLAQATIEDTYKKAA